MKLKFDSNLDYQIKAIDSVVDVFDGQQIEDSIFDFSVKEADGSLGFDVGGVGNYLQITDDKLLDNVKEVQGVNDIGDKVEELKGRNFSVEMETGTGKTYVYLRTIHELHSKYGFKKFIIVVPSIAIREGVLKNLEITQSHFQELYGKTPMDYLVYDSSKIGKLRSFATSNTLQIMVINIDAFNKKDIAVIHRENDRLSGEKPINFIQQTNPIVVMDEPQNMETDTAKKAIESLNPLCTLRYSATHRNYYNLLYRLTPVDAYDLGLVKKIEVDSVREQESMNDAYIDITSIKPLKKYIKATLEIEVETGDGIRKKKVKIDTKPGNVYDLYEFSNKRDVYRGYTVSGIDVGDGSIGFSNGEVIYEGSPKGQLDEKIQKVQIEETIREHLDKEKELQEQGIKVLSLFFIDQVKNYRDYEKEDKKGKFAQWFEEIYEKLIKEPKYKGLDLPDSEKAHEGYFSKDRKGQFKDSKTGEAQYDVPTYELIMKDKEHLLSFDSSLRFIFSHSALREGWDNPNVFQICTLNETKSKLKKRQEIGRGLRIPVNQQGDRIFDLSLNILTVIANESYESFARQLQSEIEEETGESFEDRVKDKRKRRKLKLKKQWKLDENFKDLWEKIKHKAKYQVKLDSEELVKKASQKIKEDIPKIAAPKIRAEKAELEISEETGVESRIKRIREEEGKAEPQIPNVLGYLERGTNLTKKTLYSILEQSRRMDDLLVNPQLFLDQCLEKIKLVLNDMIVDGIKYEKIAGEEYEMALFESEEIESYIDNMIEVEEQNKTLYNHVVYDSDIEKDFAKDLESSERIKFYIKLPSWFKIETPISDYNPDWAIVMEEDKKLYFIVETKGTDNIYKLAHDEQIKIKCGKKRFKVFEGVGFKGPVSNLKEVL